MTHLVYYIKEREGIGEEAYKREMSIQETEMIYHKLCRHFKLREVRIEWTSGRNHPCCNSWRICFNRSWNNFGIFCHEVAHLYQFQKAHEPGEKFHTKKHKRIMNRMINYCKKKNWFEDEIQRRTAPKIPKPELTKNEVRTKKIASLELSNKKCLSKIKRYQNLIKKNNHRIVHLKRFLGA